MDLDQWIGRTERLDDVVTATPVAALSATLDWPAERCADGTPLPYLWHWLYFLPLAPQSEIGPDGHPRRGGFLPPIELPRRMWAGSQLQFHRQPQVGERIRRRSTIEDVTRKTGRTGTLVFVKVRHDVEAAGDAEPLITEFLDIVFRPAPAPGDAPSKPQPAPAESRWRRDLRADEVMLFRYSALTFNAHRIHYDRSYVTGVEGYPGLIVHGPLQATLLMDLLRREMPQARLVRFEFRAMRPIFDVHSFSVCGEPSADGRSVRLWTCDHEGNLSMDATAELA